ncbi:hypothetical protein COD67_01805 [Bacillus cereus]|uniref:hypothetical protein n=1 Tax=Bacillus wiedmannii TaxID=1890302 RepID=UPI0007DB52D4|nr:hypothetical protein [Bacillus wiedmannii]MDA1526337.1 hypothetical protein [Bacillus cereus]OAK33680.1 hypothetical protein A6286_16545 [Bacillus wiedmannii]PFJ17574.1 hypothetical protein COI89_06470 [Bacillus cereus]PGU70824.1 hypothetical protein COD67_01805 [Bacillus cereus]
MLVLNVGCGEKIFEYADNIDIKLSKAHNIIHGDANCLDEIYEPESIDLIFMLCPYKFYPLRSKAYDVLKTAGQIVITGSISNPYFKEVWMASEKILEKKGFITVSKKQHCHPNFWHSRLSNGKFIENHTIKQIVLRKR